MSKDLLLRCICALYSLTTLGTAIVTRYVCPGDSVKLYETVTFSSQDTVLSLYKNPTMYTLVANWVIQNSTIKPYIPQEYKEKVYLDEYGNIFIRNLNHWDEETYFIKPNTSSPNVKSEVKIIIMVAPKKICTPKITHLDNLLIAHLEAEDCGIPVASLQWLDSPGLSNISGPVINLHPGHEAGTYYACLKGPALECAKISVPSDYCSSYAIGENDSRTLASGILDLKTAMSVMVPSIIAIGSLVVLIVAIYLIQKIWRRCRTGLPSEEMEDQCCVMNEESCMLFKQDAHMLVCGDIHMSDSKHENEDAGTEHPTCTSPEKAIQHIKPCDADLCKVCFANTSSMTFLPCGHTATCENCSILLEECPVCRKQIKAVVRSYY